MPRTAHPELGRTVVLAQSALSAALAQTLHHAGPAPGVWLPINLVASLDPPVARDHVVRQLRRAPAATPDSVERDLAALVADGLLTDDGATLALSDAGIAEHARVRPAVAALTRRALAGLAPDDVSATLRTLQAVTERLTA